MPKAVMLRNIRDKLIESITQQIDHAIELQESGKASVKVNLEQNSDLFDFTSLGELRYRKISSGTHLSFNLDVFLTSDEINRRIAKILNDEKGEK